jgi:hypothetical protein
VNEIGPFTAAKKIVVFNPDVPTEVRQVTGAGSPRWVSISSATFSECTTATAASGGLFWANLPSGLSAASTYQIAVYAESATAFGQAEVTGLYHPALATSAQAAAIQTQSNKIGTNAGDSPTTQTMQGRVDVAVSTRASEATLEAVQSSAESTESRLAGITSLAKWLRGLFRKDVMDAVAKAEINVGGGTYNEATDSLGAAAADRTDILAAVGDVAESVADFPATASIPIQQSGRMLLVAGDDYGEGGRPWLIERQPGAEWPEDLDDYDWEIAITRADDNRLEGAPDTVAATVVVEVASGDSRSLRVSLAGIDSAAALSHYDYEVFGIHKVSEKRWTVDAEGVVRFVKDLSVAES